MASDRPTHWIVATNNGLVRVKAIHAYPSSGALVFTGHEGERISPTTGKPLPPRVHSGDLIMAFAPGQWLRAWMDDDPYGNSLRPDLAASEDKP